MLDTAKSRALPSLSVPPQLSCSSVSAPRVFLMASSTDRHILTNGDYLKSPLSERVVAAWNLIIN